MSDIKDFHLLNSTSFENLIADLFNARENTNSYSILGRPGQKQYGIDVFSESKRTVVQCKYKDDLNDDSSIKERLKRDLRRDIQLASSSPITFEHFILASTYRHDAELQYYALALRDELELPFHISYAGWDEIRKWIIQFPEIQSRYFKKFELPFKPIELVSINVDSDNCSWEAEEGSENTFFKNDSSKAEFPVFDFTLVNNLNRTIVLKAVRLWAKYLWSGFSGIPRPTLLESSHRYQMKFEYGKENVFRTIPPLEIPKEQAFRFQLETIKEYDGQAFPIDNRNIFYFEFEFNSNIRFSLPKVFINTNNESNSIPIIELN